MRISNELVLMYEEKTFCSYCKGPLEKSEQERGYHQQCYLEMQKDSPGFLLLDQLSSQDQTLIESLQQFKISNVTHIADEIVFTGESRQIVVQLTSSNPRTILSIAYRFPLRNLDFVFPFTSTKEYLTITDIVQVDQFTAKELFGPDTLLILSILFDELVTRKLRTEYSALVVDKILEIKSIINLPFYGFKDDKIYFTHFYDEIGDRPFVQLDFQSNEIVSIRTYLLENTAVQQLLTIKRSFLKNLTLVLNTEETDFLKLFLNINHIEELVLYIKITKKQKDIDFEFDFFYIQHLQLKRLYLDCSQNLNKNRNVKIINIPNKVQIQVLALDGVFLPPIQKWKVETLIFNSNSSPSKPIQLDKLPDNLNELQLNYLNTYKDKISCNIVHTKVTKLILLGTLPLLVDKNFNNMDRKERMLYNSRNDLDMTKFVINNEELKNNLLQFFPNATITALSKPFTITKKFLSDYYKEQKNFLIPPYRRM